MNPVLPMPPVTSLLAELEALPGVSVRASEPMAKHTPLRVGGPAELWATVESPEQLGAVLSAARRARVSWRIHWPMGDWLVRDGGLRGLVIRPGMGFEQISTEGDNLWVGASTLWSGLAGRSLTPTLDALARWPGSVGGLLAQGEGARLAGLVTAVRWFRGRRFEEIAVPAGEAPPEIPATAVLVAVALSPEPRMINPRRRFQADPPPFAGALFTPPDGDAVGRLLGRAGLGTARLRSWQLTPAGTVVQLGGGSCRDVLLLAQGLTERIEKERGVSLQPRLAVFGTDAAVGGAGA